MFIVILRSVCVGIAFVVGALFVGLPLFFYFFGKHVPGVEVSGDGREVGWDLVTVFQNSSTQVKLIPLVIFVVGFLVGFRYFSRSLAAR